MSGPAALVIVGPTASAKSALALAMARRRGDADIVSVDSMSVYRGMDIGTAKPGVDDRAEVPHHLLDIVDPHESFSVAWFAEEARRVMAQVEQASRRSILVGGTGLYHRAVVDEFDIPGEFPELRRELDAEERTTVLFDRLRDLDPLAASRMEATNRRRVLRALEVTLGTGRPFSSFGPGLDAYPESRHTLIGLHVPRDDLDARIDERWDRQIRDGFVEEVRRLWDAPRPPGRTASQALGYRELHLHLEGELDLEEASRTAKRRIRRFAVRQQRWFRRDPRIEWFDAPRTAAEVEALADRLTATVW